MSSLSSVLRGSMGGQNRSGRQVTAPRVDGDGLQKDQGDEQQKAGEKRQAPVGKGRQAQRQRLDGTPRPKTPESDGELLNSLEEVPRSPSYALSGQAPGCPDSLFTPRLSLLPVHVICNTARAETVRPIERRFAVE